MLRPWKGRVLPLHHTRMVDYLVINVGVPGFEPGASKTQIWRATKLRYTPHIVHVTTDSERCPSMLAGETADRCHSFLLLLLHVRIEICVPLADYCSIYG